MNRWIKFIIKCSKLYDDEKLVDKVINSDKPRKTMREYYKVKYEEPNITGELDYPEIKSKLLNVSDGASTWITDPKYKTTDKKSIKRYLKKNRIDRKEYIKTWHDCEDFSYQLMGDIRNWNSKIAFGIVFGRQHAFNFFITKDLEVYAVEPQNDKIIPFNDYIKPDEVWVMIM